MTAGQVLVHVEPGAAAEQRVRYALSMARSRGSKLVGLTVRLSPQAATSSMIGDVSALTAYCDASGDSVHSAKDLFERVTHGSGVTVEWRESYGVPLEVVVAEAGSADLIVLGRASRARLDGGMYVIRPDDVIMGSGVPVLVVPDVLPTEYRGSRILVAWKSTPQAARAVRDAMPWLARAEAVFLTEVMSPVGRYEIPAKTMAEYLMAHGVPVSILQIPAGGVVEDLLMNAAAANECDMIVAGAYGHSRLREWTLGGVTRSLLERSPLPCLLAH
ncbi:MAG TPA: universal stress protein [Alphaproteobacteria bacterium]|jgi:nucleotide-binding universal stress UspA family protein|nr:universal stress protein [Alphaproteobacteria bacterium]